MRRHTDAQGHAWDVVVGRESFGALYALFVPAGSNPGEMRQALLGADSQAEADAELDALSSEELNELLRESEPKRLQ
jgi:hypothetical protein